MSLIVTQGYLIARYDYNLFDEILVFINNFGNKFTCFAAGTRKINSKNARSLNYGNHLEFEFFYSNNEKKISRLKKVTSLNQVEFSLSYNLGILIASEMLTIKNKTTINDYKFYQTILVYAMESIDELKIAVFSYIYYLFTEYKKKNIFLCKKHNIYSKKIDLFSTNLFCCEVCEIKKQYYKVISNEEFLFIANLLNSKNIDELEKNFFRMKYNINWKNLYDYLNYTFNEYIRCIRQNFKKGNNQNGFKR